jgi:hypothetical protein
MSRASQGGRARAGLRGRNLRRRDERHFALLDRRGGTIVAIDEKGARVVPSETTEDLLAVADSEIERSKLEGSFRAVIAVGNRGTVVVQGAGRNKISPFEQLRVPMTDDLIAIVSNNAFGFVVAPRMGGLYLLGLDTNARHPFPPE